MPEPARAVVSADGSTITLERRAWSTTFPVDQLPGQKAFYARLGARKGGKYLPDYAPVITALERAERVLATYQRKNP